MKPDNYNQEVELWLRRLAKTVQSETSVASGLGSPTDVPRLSRHLDADELNSFAEGLVPQPARPRYLEHLVECNACRSIVAGLTQSAGGLVTSTLPITETKTGFWSRVGAFFSPATLRYAVPALAVATMIAIGLLALRQPRSSDYVAQHQPVSAPPIGQTSDSESTAKTGTASAPQPSVETRRNLELDKANTSSKDRTDLFASGTPTETTTSTLGKDSAQPRLNEGAPASKPTFAPEPLAAAPAPPAKAAPEDADNLAAIKREELSEREAQQKQEYRVSTREAADENRPAGAKSAPAPAGARRTQGLMTQEKSSDNKSKADTTGSETRKVAGKSFRREGGVWVDTSYERSRSTTNVARGSEQFRALVADEPGLRAIADQLGGEVVVVWKGRAYRIR